MFKDFQKINIKIDFKKRTISFSTNSSQVVFNVIQQMTPKITENFKFYIKILSLVK